jgi:beta-glucosidase
MTNILRKEWGMKGAAITDCSVFAGYMDIAMGVLAGQDLWDGSGSAGTLVGYETTPAMVHCMHTATKRLVYSISHSIAMNGISSSSKIVAIESWWLTLLKVMTFVGFGIAAVSATLMVVEIVLVKKN